MILKNTSLVQSGECEEETTGCCPAQLAQCGEARLLVDDGTLHLFFFVHHTPGRSESREVQMGGQNSSSEDAGSIFRSAIFNQYRSVLLF